MVTVADKDILEAQRMLAAKEGIFVEPASASTIAGVRKLVDERSIDSDEETVCITTGNGLKDQEAVTYSTDRTIRTKPTPESVLAVLTQTRSIQAE
jgi:threonine synthase